MATIYFKLRGRAFELSTKEVEARLSNVQLGPVRKHAVEVAGRLYPVTAALAHVLGVEKVDVPTHVARQKFQALGFRVVSGQPAGGGD
ncbi:MAG: hypothetical protein ACYDGR_07185 [Candidatus Dormibacteria bacterium]